MMVQIQFEMVKKEVEKTIIIKNYNKYYTFEICLCDVPKR